MEKAPDYIQNGYAKAEEILRSATEGAKNHAELQGAMNSVQVMCQRILAVMIFNVSKDAETAADHAGKVFEGINAEIAAIITASKDETNMRAIQINGGEKDEAPKH